MTLSAGVAKIVRLLSAAFLGLGVVCAVPFILVGLALDSAADDLEDKWRRGRQQNWLWRWAHSNKDGNR